MADPPPRTQSWKAWQNVQPRGTAKLIVTGLVEISNTNQTPRLRERDPPGINILLLDLTMTTSGTGNTMTWRDARFEKDIQKDQYASVDIYCDGKKVGQADVETGQ